MKNKKIEILIITIILIVQTLIYVICGMNKQYIHMDEAYSLGLASYDKFTVQDNDDFYNNWHNKEYYEDYLSVQEDEIGDYSPVIENQKIDAHPPLYYFILRIAMGIFRGYYSKWPGIIINIIVFAFITIFTYLILCKLLKNEKNVKEKSIILAFISSITMASITNAIYIRMYALSTLNVVITTFLHMKLFEEKRINTKLFILIGLSALVGSLTHYYYLFYLFAMYIIFVIKYIKEKEWKKLLFYTLTMIIAAILSLIIFPYSVQNLLFGHRGKEAMGTLGNVSEYFEHIKAYWGKINRFTFNNLLIPIIIIIVGLIIIKLIKKVKGYEKNKVEKILVIPTIFFFVIVAIASPYIELRYIMPICGLSFILVIYYLYKLLKMILNEKLVNTVVILILATTLISPIIFKIEPEVMYSDKKEIVEKLKNELNLPTIYLFNSGHNRFLDDILLFSIIDESYVAKDLECTKENIQNILENKDIQKGLIIFLNEGQDHKTALDTIKDATNLNKVEHLKRLNACDVYYLGK